MFEVQRAFLRPGQQTGSLEHVLNLPPIQFHTRQIVQLLIAEGLCVDRVSNELGPNVPPRFKIEVLVSQRNVNSRLKGRIDMFGSIRGQEQNALVGISNNL